MINHRKKYTLVYFASLCLLFIFCQPLHAQVKELVASGGQSVNSNYLIEESLGQSFVNQLSNGSYVLSEGFQQHQSVKVFREADEHQVKIYPNPSSLFLNIESNIILDRILIYDERGSIIRTIENIEKSNLKLDIKDLLPGIYILRLIDINNYVSTQKLIKT